MSDVVVILSRIERLLGGGDEEEEAERRERDEHLARALANVQRTRELAERGQAKLDGERAARAHSETTE